MIKIKREYTRPSIDIPWHNEVLPDVEFKTKLQTYIDLNKHISYNITHSEDGLRMLYEGIWIDRAAFDEYDVDPDLVPYWNLRNEYYESVGIIVGPKVFETL
jgi:hypothetical protein